MCGICGEWSAQGVDAGLLARMQARLVHRGPDGSGQVVRDDVGIAARRLAVERIDDGEAARRNPDVVAPLHGRQPMSDESGELWVVCNGEIYNHHELRRELEGRSE